jgi:benzoylformate decarboxylase
MYAEASGKPGVVNLHVAPGLGNAVGALYNACTGNIPLVITVGQQDSRMVVREPVLTHDLVGMARSLTKWAVEIHHPEEIPVVIPRAFKLAQDPPSGPVLVALPSNVLEGEADLHLPEADRTTYREARPDPQGIEAAARLLARAKMPVIVCGHGVSASRSQEELVTIAEMLGAPVYDTMFSGGLNFPMSHTLFRGNLLPEHRGVRAMLAQADAVLAVGAKLFTEAFYAPEHPLPEGSTLIHLDNSASEVGKNFPATVGLPTDITYGLDALSTALSSKMNKAAEDRAEERRTRLNAQKAEEKSRQEARIEKGRGKVPLSPALLMAELRDGLPENAVIFDEAITASADLIRTIQPDRPGHYFSSHGGGLGQGLPGAIGIKLAKPDHPVIAVVGDGSAMYMVQSLWSAAHHRVPVIYIIISNQSYRILKYNMNRFRRVMGLTPGEPAFPFMDLDDPPLNFVEIARGMGLKGQRIARPEEIRTALEEALSAQTPCVLEVLTEKQVPVQ